MTNPYSRRDCNRPVLKSGLKWPCYTLHTTPLLQVERGVTLPSAKRGVIMEGLG